MFPYYQSDPIISNKVLFPHLDKLLSKNILWGIVSYTPAFMLFEWENSNIIFFTWGQYSTHCNPSTCLGLAIFCAMHPSSLYKQFCQWGNLTHKEKKKSMQNSPSLLGFLSALFWNCLLCWDRGRGDVPCHLHLTWPCCVALGRILIWGLNPIWGALSNGFPLSYFSFARFNI